eukprot:5264593-Prorocentrum_lima.AAC.1
MSCSWAPPTIRGVPEQTHHALQEVLQNVLALIIEATTAVQRARAWKLFIAHPKLLLGTEGGKGGRGRMGNKWLQSHLLLAPGSG